MHCCYEEVVGKDLEHGVHLSGIGGVGMTALAEMLLDIGVEVTGSDTSYSKNVESLQKRGVIIYPSHKKEHIGDKLVCRTRAVKDDNEEVAFAKKAVYRSTLLSFLAKGKKQIVVTGAHGKTSVSALLSHCMIECGFDISFAVGGYSESLRRYGKISSGEFFVVEGDESDGSHLKTIPFGAIVTSCDLDHLAFWKEGNRLQDSYLEFMDKVDCPNHLIYFGEDNFLKDRKIEGISFGVEVGDYRAEDIVLECGSCSFSVGGDRIYLPMFGEYNIKNALSVLALLESLGVKRSKVIKAFTSFKGIMRRMEYLGKNIYSDYAHHPTEVEEVLKSVDKISEDMVIIFEPHRISRFQDEMENFVKVFSNVIITDVFEASEGMIVDTLPLIEYFCKKTNSTYIPLAKMKVYLQTEKRKVLALGAGCLDGLLKEFVLE